MFPNPFYDWLSFPCLTDSPNTQQHLEARQKFQLETEQQKQAKGSKDCQDFPLYLEVQTQ